MTATTGMTVPVAGASCDSLVVGVGELDSGASGLPMLLIATTIKEITRVAIAATNTTHNRGLPS